MTQQATFSLASPRPLAAAPRPAPPHPALLFRLPAPVSIFLQTPRCSHSTSYHSHSIPGYLYILPPYLILLHADLTPHLSNPILLLLICTFPPLHNISLHSYHPHATPLYYIIIILLTLPSLHILPPLFLSSVLYHLTPRCPHPSRSFHLIPVIIIVPKAFCIICRFPTL